MSDYLEAIRQGLPYYLITSNYFIYTRHLSVISRILLAPIEYDALLLGRKSRAKIGSPAMTRTSSQQPTLI